MSSENSYTDSFGAAAMAAASGETVVVNTPEQETPVVVDTPVIETPDEPVETPAVETVVTEEPVVEAPKEVIREVEKIVEKYPEFKSEKAKEYYERIISAGDDDALQAIIDYGREKKRDYSTMSDLDVVKANLTKSNPHWNEKEVDLEVRVKYGDELEKIDLTTIDKDLDPDDYDRAVLHNKLAQKNLDLLSRDARDNRHTLIEQQRNLELPKIEQPVNTVVEPQAPSAEEIEENNRIWQEKVDKETSGLSNISVKVGDKAIAHNFTEDEKKQLVSDVKTFTPQSFFTQRGWMNQDGTTNSENLAKDMFVLNNFEKLVNSFAGNVKTETTKEVIKDIKNIVPVTPAAQTGNATFADAFMEARERAK